jgi:hypothetical protein
VARALEKCSRGDSRDLTVYARTTLCSRWYALRIRDPDMRGTRVQDGAKLEQLKDTNTTSQQDKKPKLVSHFGQLAVGP